MNFGCCSAYNHRTTEIGRDIWRLNPNPLLKRGSMRAGCLEPSWVLSLSKDGGCSPAFVGYLSPCLTTLTVFLKHQKSWSGIYFILFGAQWFWSFHWVPLRRVLLHLLYSPSHIFIYTGEMYTCTPWRALLISRPNGTSLFQLLLVQQMFRWDVFYNHCFVFSRLKLWVLDSSQYGLKTKGNS